MYIYCEATINHIAQLPMIIVMSKIGDWKVPWLYARAIRAIS